MTLEKSLNINNAFFTTSKLASGLYIVSTPIGNIEDITIRALRVLKSCDVIACEDTRVTNKLLNYYDIFSKLICYNDFSNENDRKKIIQLIKCDKSVALVSDAGTPLISDPGFKLVRDIKDNNLNIFSVPGASSVISALTLSGLPTDKFTFIGFLPPRKDSRIKCLKQISEVKNIYVFFESAKRLVKTLTDMSEVFPSSVVSVNREITKKFEESRNGLALDLLAYYTKKPPKGEVVLILDNNCDIVINDDDLINIIKEKNHDMSPKELCKYISDKYGLNKKAVYQKILDVKNED